MPPKRKRARTAAINARNSRTPIAALPNVLNTSFAEVKSDTFQMAVVNSCTTNEDIRLPTAPTPALLFSFYAHSSSNEEDAASGVPNVTPWKPEFWLHRVAHVPLGRHSALPAAYRLRHDYVSRLHARIVYVRSAAMHRRFIKFFPCIERSNDKAPTHIEAERSEPNNANAETDEEADVVIVEPVNVDSLTPPPPPFAFVSPYYLLVNYSENPVYVDRDCVPRGRSARLQEGDVVSFLECAFDADGGIFDDDIKSNVVDVPHNFALADADHENLVEPTSQLTRASLEQWCVSPSQLTAKPVFPLRTHRRLLAQRRLYDVPSLIQKYVKWWYTHAHTSTPEPSRTVSGPWLVSRNQLDRIPSLVTIAASPTTPECQLLVRIGDDGNGEPSSSSLTMKRHCNLSESKEPTELFDVRALENPNVAASLRQWLNETEDLEDVSDDTLSPLAARLTLDRAWLRRVVRHVCGPQRCERSHSAHTSRRHSPMKAEEKEADDNLRTSPLPSAKLRESKGSVKTEADAEFATRTAAAAPALLPAQTALFQDVVAEQFRVSLSLLCGSPSAPHASATPPRASNVVHAVLDELRSSRGDVKATVPTQLPPSAALDSERHSGNTENARQPSCRTTEMPVCRALHLDDDPIEVFGEEPLRARKSETRAQYDHDPERDGSISNTLLSTSAGHSDVTSDATGRTTTVPGVRLGTAILPVYVFTRRCNSPDAYTREGAPLRPFSPVTRNKVMKAATTTAAGPTAQYVYYFDPEESQRACGDQGNIPKSHDTSDPASPVATTKQQLVNDDVFGVDTSSVQFDWIDESEQKETARKKRCGRRRKRHN